jgi:adenylosuccinate lyase
MKLGGVIGRDRAHALVKELSDEARLTETSFSEAVRTHPVIQEHLSEKEIEDCVEPRAYLGRTQALVTRVLSRYRRSLGRKT